VSRVESTHASSARILTRTECLDYLSRVPVGRIGVSIDALPVILPVSFTLSGETLLFRTIPGTKLDAATIGAVVAFQADGFEPSADGYWTVMVRGIPTEVDGDQDRLADSVPIPTWGDLRPNHRLVGLEATNIVGRLFPVSAGDRAHNDPLTPPSPGTL